MNTNNSKSSRNHSLVLICIGSAIAVFLLLPLETESIYIKWFIAIIFAAISVRLVLSEYKIKILRALMFALLMMIFYYLKFELNLDRTWETRRILFEHRLHSNRAVVLQTMETGEWPKIRVIDRKTLLPSVYWNLETFHSIKPELDTVRWKRTN